MARNIQQLCKMFKRAETCCEMTYQEAGKVHGVSTSTIAANFQLVLRILRHPDVNLSTQLEERRISQHNKTLIHQAESVVIMKHIQALPVEYIKYLRDCFTGLTT